MTVVVLKQRQPAEKRIPRKWAVRFPLEITLSAAQHPWEEHLTRIPTQHRLEPSFGKNLRKSVLFDRELLPVVMHGTCFFGNIFPNAENTSGLKPADLKKGRGFGMFRDVPSKFRSSWPPQQVFIVWGTPHKIPCSIFKQITLWC